MFISDFSIRRPIITIVTMIALVVFGLVALVQLDTDEYPELTQPIVFIGVAYPGAAPDVVEREVVNRLEDKISGISGVDKLNSTSTDGFAQLIVQFVFSKNVDQATQDIRDAISAVRGQLPAEIIEPVIARFDPAQLPIISLALTSNVCGSNSWRESKWATVLRSFPRRRRMAKRSGWRIILASGPWCCFSIPRMGRRSVRKRPAPFAIPTNNSSKRARKSLASALIPTRVIGSLRSSIGFRFL